MLRVLQSTNQTCLAINQVIADCEKVLQKAETSSTLCKKKLYTCIHIACLTGSRQGVCKTWPAGKPANGGCGWKTDTDSKKCVWITKVVIIIRFLICVTEAAFYMVLLYFNPVIKLMVV